MWHESKERSSELARDKWWGGQGNGAEVGRRTSKLVFYLKVLQWNLMRRMVIKKKQIKKTRTEPLKTDGENKVLQNIKIGEALGNSQVHIRLFLWLFGRIKKLSKVNVGERIGTWVLRYWLWSYQLVSVTQLMGVTLWTMTLATGFL